MSHNRDGLSDIFHNTLGVKNVYFQPPTSVHIKYPCVVYKRLPYSTLKADNRLYRAYGHYQATYITKDPDSDIPLQMLNTFEMISHNSRFTSDNLYHDVFDIYY